MIDRPGKKIKIAVLGAGAWGTALACATGRADHDVVIWGRNEPTIDEINHHRSNSKYLGDIQLPDYFRATCKLAQATNGAQIILLVTPAQTISGLLPDLQAVLTSDQIVISCAKGIDAKSGQTPAELIASIVPPSNIGVLSGPSFASDVAQAKPTAVTLAFNDMVVAKQQAEFLSSDTMRVYASDDLKGVELGGALKNVLALAVGVARGLKLGASAEAALIARGFGELRRLATKLGAQPETLSGLSGLGDLVLTASTPQSRNFSYGIALGQQRDLLSLPLAEGVFTAKIAASLANENGVHSPIITAVSNVLAGSISPTEAVQNLLARPIKAENE